MWSEISAPRLQVEAWTMAHDRWGDTPISTWTAAMRRRRALTTSPRIEPGLTLKAHPGGSGGSPDTGNPGDPGTANATGSGRL